MRIVRVYDFNDPDRLIASRHPEELTEIRTAISAVKAVDYRVPLSREKTKEGRVLYSSTALNQAFRSAFTGLGWKNLRVKRDDTVQYYIGGYLPPPSTRKGAPEMDFVRKGLVVQVQLGRYFFMVDNIATKLTMFKDLGTIDAGVEILPMQEFAAEMSRGMSYFEQLLSNLERGGKSYIDVPVLILGIAP